ncbi:MAG: glycosyltransferase [Bacillota bacterium]
MNSEKIIVLIMIGNYLPGYKGGGPTRSIANLVDLLGEAVKFKIITLDRDFGEDESYSDILYNGWNIVGKADVMYLSPYQKSFWHIKNIINMTKYDFLYLNGFFDSKFSITTIILSAMMLIKKKPLVLAPRGEFSQGALAIKFIKKKIYINMSKFFNLYRGVIWHTTSMLESNDIKKIFGNNVDLRVASNISSASDSNNIGSFIVKVPGKLKVVFLSRISPKKNLLSILEILRKFDGAVQFHIYGPIEDPIYWTKCLKIIDNLPANIIVKYCGVVNPSDVQSVFSRYHLFFFPTLGENYGHVIIESFLAGCPVLLSDQTPWRDLYSKKIGWDIPLSRRDLFLEALRIFVDMNDEDFQIWSENARAFGHSVANNNDIENDYLRLFSVKS